MVYALRAASVFGVTSAHNGIEFLTIPCRNVLDVGYVLETPLNLERSDSSIEKVFEIVCAVHVAHTQEVALGKDLVIASEEPVWHTTKLCALSAIGAAIVAYLGGIAASVVADTYCSVDKDFERHRWHSLMYAAYFVNGELACQNGLLIPLLQTFPDDVGTAVVHLG